MNVQQLLNVGCWKNSMERNERNTVGLRNFFDSLASVLIGIRNLQTSEVGFPEAEEILTQLEEASVTLRLLASENAHEVYETPLGDLQTFVGQVRVYMQSFCENISLPANTSFRCEVEIPRGAGRPRIIIEDEQIHFLRSLHFSWGKIAWLLGVSESTLRRKRQEMHMTDNEQYTWANITGQSIYTACSQPVNCIKIGHRVAPTSGPAVYPILWYCISSTPLLGYGKLKAYRLSP